MDENASSLYISILGCGWLGLPLLRSLVNAGHQVKGSSRNPETLAAIKAAGATPYHIDLPGEIPIGFLGSSSSVLLITLPPRGRQLGSEASRHYLACLQSIPELKAPGAPHIFFTSSTGVYGDAKGEVTESSPTQPNTHSSRAVLAAEQWLSAQTDSLVILRLAGLIAEDRHPGRFYGGRDRPIPNADAPVNLVHREDVISAVHLLLQKLPQKDIFNVCADSHPAKGTYYKRASERIGLTVSGSQQGGSGDKTISSMKLRNVGWRPMYDKLM